MIRIDLGKSPDQRKSAGKHQEWKTDTVIRRIKIEKTDMGGVLLLIGAVAFAFLPYLFVEQYKDRARQKHSSIKAQLNDEKSNLEANISKYKSYQTELDNFEKQSALLAQRLNAVNDLLSSRIGPVATLDAVGQSLPKGAWLDQIALVAEPEPALQLNGSSYSSEDITDFAEKLSNSIHFQNVELREVSGAAANDKEQSKKFIFTAVPKSFKVFKKEQTRDTASKN